MRAGGSDFWDEVRADVVGSRASIDTPFGPREMTYADFTASGRAVGVIERYMRNVLELYGNTHTEDDATGRVTTERLHAAERTIKRILGATDAYRLIEVGSGTTGAVHRLQQILGIYLPPAAKATFASQLRAALGEEATVRLVGTLEARRPVVFVGPYEHHSNEVSWRECWADVVEIGLTDDGLLDLDDLVHKLSDTAYEGRRKIGAFSAASNVSGVKTRVYDVARILHEHDALAFFDFAAIAPYVRIDVHRDELSYFDAIYLSPHKYLGGPGASGLLLIHEGIYRADLPPTVGAGGTVNFVDFTGQDYSDDIEVREKPGTPGILQILRASLAMELLEKMDPDRISLREDELVGRAIERLDHPSIEILGPLDPAQRIAIISFNVREGTSYLHPRFVTLLLNDLFGIQSRAGCSCAGPYGHRMLHLDETMSAALRERIHRGVLGLRPGWVRVNFHFLMSDEEADFIIDAIRFVAERGRSFLPLYTFDVRTGAWRFRDAPGGPRGTSPRATATTGESFGLAEALAMSVGEPEDPLPVRTDEGSGAEETVSSSIARRRAYLDEAARLAGELESAHPDLKLRSTLKDLIPFVYV